MQNKWIGNRFAIDSELCELLLAFQSAPSLAELSGVLGRDVSVVSRQLQRLARSAPVLEKERGRWVLNSLGESLSQWAKDSILSQRLLLGRERMIRIASTREFMSRVLAPQWDTIRKDIFADVHLTLLSAEDGVERLLLNGNADIGIDCGKPQDPFIQFKTVLQESFSIVASPSWIRKNKVKNYEKLIHLPYLQYHRMSAPRLLKLTHQLSNISATFNDISCVREACIRGAGWAILPTYAVSRELREKSLKRISSPSMNQESFGVWWLRRRKICEPYLEPLVRWLERQKL